MIWSFLWRWVLASAVLAPIALFSAGFVVGVLFGDGPNTLGVPVFFATLALCAAGVIAHLARRRRSG